MSTKRFVFRLCLVSLLLVLSFGSEALASSPTAQIRSTTEQVIKILSDAGLQGKDNKEERRRLLRETISARFDFGEMARRSLGPNWRSLKPEDQTEFVRLFTRLLEKVYTKRIESYHDERFVYTGEKIDGPYAEVDSQIVTTRGEEIPLNYMLHRVGDAWKIYDVAIENVSLVNNYRSQFDRVIYQQSYGELVRRIKQKLAEN